MARIFISHSSANNAEALAIAKWLGEQGWDDVFLDIDPQRGLIAGERWQNALKSAASRCEVVVFMLSPAWVKSKWCLAEFLLAKQMNKRIMGVLAEKTDISALPVEMTAEYQLVDLTAPGPSEQIGVEVDKKPVTVKFASDGLTRLRHGLQVSGIDAGFFHWPPEDDPSRSPYPGLRPLDTEDAGIFFGRDGQIITGLDLVRRLRDAGAPRLMVILGASGSGKSSFMRAGLLPRLERDDRHFTVLPPVRPERGALYGETGLLNALCDAFAAARKPKNRASVRKAIEGGADAVAALLAELVDAEARAATKGDDEPAARHAVIVPVDQGEALFAAEGRDEAITFLELFRDLLNREDVPVIGMITIRSDNYERLQTEAALEGIRSELLSLPPMPGGAYGEVIQGPARRLTLSGRKLALDDTLVETLLSDIEKGGSKDALPLLAFTLERLYSDYGDDGDLTLAEYNELGGISGSINAAVERALKRADGNGAIPADREARLNVLRRGLIPWLAGIDPDTGSPRRRVARLSEIPAEARPLMELLVEERLLSTDVDPDTRETTIEPAHEALLRQWGRLEGWLEEDLRELTAIEGVRRATRDWAANGKNPQWLAHVAGRLEDAESAARREDLKDLLQPTDLEYLAAARDAEDKRAKAELIALRRQRMLAIIAGGIFAAASVVAGVLWLQADAARKAEEIARKEEEVQRIHAQAAEKIARSRLALAEGSIEDAIALSLEGYKLETSPDSRSATLTALMEISPNLTALVRGAGADATTLSWNEETITIATRGATLRSFSAKGAFQSASNLLIGGAPDPQWLHDPVFVTGLPGGGTVTVLTSGEMLISAKGGSITSVPAPAGDQPLYAGPHKITASGDATVFAMARTDRSVMIRRCELQTGRPACRDQVIDTLDPEALALTRDGSLLAVAGPDGAIAIHNTATGAQTGGGSSVEASPLSLAWSSDNRTIAVGTRSGNLSLLDANALAPEIGTGVLATQKVSRGAITALRWSPDGGRIAIVCDEQEICIYETADKSQDVLEEPGQRLFGHSGAIAGLAWSPDGNALASMATDSSLRLWSLAEDTHLRHDLEPATWHPLLAIAADPASDRIVGVDDGGGIHVWDGADTLAAPAHLVSSGEPDAVSSVALSSEGLVAAIHERIGLAAGKTGSSDPLPLTPIAGNRVARTAIGKGGLVAAVPAQSNTVALYDPASGTLRSLEGPADQGEPFGVVFHPDDKRLFTSQTNGALMEWPLEEGSTPRVIAGPDASGPDAIGGGSLSVSPDGRWLTASNAPRVVVHDLTGAAGPVRLEFDAGDRDVKTVAFSPDGGKLAVLLSNGKLYVWNWNDGEAERFVTTRAVPERSIAGKAASRRRAASWIAWSGNTTLVVATAAGRVQILNVDETAWLERADAIAVSDFSAGG
ncbi:MAG: TIR domain-containing protein [Rhodobiaceae bacterium]|nr:TIR domain-containing protein [Rhodobiaceae bacterium]MCC0049929.1 TIR domain-containing protein [Rhodobiaceae bacterium]